MHWAFKASDKQIASLACTSAFIMHRMHLRTAAWLLGVQLYDRHQHPGRQAQLLAAPVSC